MFKLVSIEDRIQVPARLFGYPRLEALEHAVNKRFSDKIIPGVGLCIAFWDWIEIGEDSLQILSGDSSTQCSFRVVVFAPFEGEAVFGRISGACKNGIFMELGFFDAIVLPKEQLPKPSVFDEQERAWIWKPSFDGVEQTMYMDVTNEHVFRVREILYDDQSKIPPAERAKEDRNPMSIIASLYDDVLEDTQGLGDPLWWYEEGEDDGDLAEGDGAEDIDGDAEYDEEAYPTTEEGNALTQEDEQPAGKQENEEMTDWNGEEDQGNEAQPMDATKTEMQLHGA